MSPRPSFPKTLTSRHLQITRSLQTSAPLPPPTHPLPPISSSTSTTPSQPRASTSTSTSTSLSHLPPLLPSTRTPATSTPITTSTALNHLKAQTTPSTGIYLIARLHSRTYLLHPRDTLTLPTLKPILPPGSTLSLNRILEVGSREYAIKSPAADGKSIMRNAFSEGTKRFDAGSLESIPPWVASCQLTILEHTKSPLQRTILKKRRKGYQKTIENKQGWTRLRVGDIILGDGVPPPGHGVDASVVEGKVVDPALL